MLPRFLTRVAAGSPFGVLVVGVASVLACTPAAIPSERHASGVVDSATVEVNGTRIFYEATGHGSVVVLLHAGNLDRRMWDPQFVAFGRTHRVIRYDARGYGRSGRALAPYRANEDLHALLVALGVSRVSLVGSSLGGRIAVDFALANPGMVERLVLVAPGLSGWNFVHRDTTWVPEARQARDRGDSAGIALAWLKQDFMRPAMEQSTLAAALRRIAADNGRFWMDFVRYPGEADEQGTPVALGRTRLLRAPTLLITGTRDTPDIAGIADSLARSVPSIRRVTFDGAGHLPSAEQPDRFNRVVLAFLRQ